MPFRPTLPASEERILSLTYHSEPLSFDDCARQSGLYILGKPRMGKSWSMVNLMIQDREKRHGIFFIDPHRDAIDKLLENLSYSDLPKKIIQEFVGFCTLLANPENCIKVKSGQYTEREINSRTEQDMIGERARELMALPKYTVCVKKLDSSHGTKIYKTRTRALPDVATDTSGDIRKMIEDTRRSVCRLRRDVQDEIYNRQMPVTEESGPPSPYD